MRNPSSTSGRPVTRFTDLVTVKELARLNPSFTEGGLRWLIFNANKSGFDRVIRRCGRRVLMSLTELDAWVDNLKNKQDQGDPHGL